MLHVKEAYVGQIIEQEKDFSARASEFANRDSEIVLAFLKAAAEGNYETPIEGPGEMAQAARELQDHLCARRERLHRVEEDLRRMAPITGYIEKLVSHAENSSGMIEQFMSEIDERAHMLRSGLEETESHMASSLSSAGSLRKDAAAELTEVSAALQGHLQQIKGDLEDKAENTAVVLRAIGDIGKGVRLLALNATIEAKRAGEYGAGFAVVADEVRSLSQLTMERAEEAGQMVDLSAINQSFAEIITHCEENLGNLTTKISQAIEQLEAMFEHMVELHHGITENNQVIFEILDGSREVSGRGMSKIRWAARELAQANKILDAPLEKRSQAIGAYLAENRIWVDPEIDILDRIRKRGRIRVAIEPAFVGLSFRRNPSEPLRGLDADYIQAFADWLGVEVEFIEQPWDVVTELLYTGPRAGEPKADLVWSALPPDASYAGLAYSETYTYLNFVLCRRSGDDRIRDVSSLGGMTLGIINDPGAYSVLEEVGVRWTENQNKPGGKVHLANLIAYSDQSRIHDCLAEGVVDAFAVDLPIYHWACSNPESPWKGKIEILPANLAKVPYYYTAAVAGVPESYRLLAKINEFIAHFKGQRAREEIERKWQGNIVTHSVCYRDEPGNLVGEPELERLYQNACAKIGIAPRQP